MLAHGRIDLYWRDNILCVDAFGPFNDEGVTSAAAIYLDTIKHNDFEDFFVIETWDKDSFGSPSVYQVVDKNWAAFAAYGCKGLAVVVSDQIQKSLAERILPEIGQVFTSKDNALQWLQQLSKG